MPESRFQAWIPSLDLMEKPARGGLFYMAEREGLTARISALALRVRYAHRLRYAQVDPLIGFEPLPARNLLA